MARVPFDGVLSTPASVDGYIQISSGPTTIFKFFVDTMKSLGVRPSAVSIGDIGCGPCIDYAYLQTTYPKANIHGYEASPLMLEKAIQYINPDKTTLTQATIPDFSIPYHRHDLTISCLSLNSLPAAEDMWNTINQITAPGGDFFVFDLVRMEDYAQCEEAVTNLCLNLTPQSKADFISGLQAAYIKEEVEQQLADIGMNATVSVIEFNFGIQFLLVQGKAR